MLTRILDVRHDVRHSESEQSRAAVFAALGDDTRLSILAKLSGGERFSIAELTEGTTLTRQAVTKHLHVLERVHIVQATKTGRENLFALNPQPIQEMTEYLEAVSKRWTGALNRLKAFVEENPE